MSHVRGLGLPGCLALAALASLVHSQHGKGALGGLGQDRGCGKGLRDGVSCLRTENTGTVPR